MDMDALREDISFLKELAKKNIFKDDLFDESSATKDDVLAKEDKAKLDAIFSQLNLEAQQDAEKVTSEPKEEDNGAMNQSMAVVTTLLASLIIGTFLGCICLYCVMKCMRKGRVPSGMQFESESQEPKRQDGRRIVRQ